MTCNKTAVKEAIAIIDVIINLLFILSSYSLLFATSSAS